VIRRLIRSAIMLAFVPACSPESTTAAGPGAEAGPDADSGLPDAETLTPIDDPPPPARGYFMGTLPTPAEGQDLAASHAQLAAYGDWVPEWGRPSAFWELAGDLAGSWGETNMGTLIRGNGMFPLVHVAPVQTWGQPACPPGLEGCTLSTPAWREAYKTAVLDVVHAARPRYLSLGNEINRWYEAVGDHDGDPNAFRYFVSLYDETYDAVKAIAPQTLVFVVFSREIVSELREADMTVLSRFDPARLDLVAFTLYSYSVRTGPRTFRHASDIPDDYLAAAVAPLGKKRVAITELGWPTDAFYGGEQGQVDFLDAVVGRLTTAQGLKLELLGWDWLHDQPGGDTTGLIGRDGHEKLVWERWKALYE